MMIINSLSTVVSQAALSAVGTFFHSIFIIRIRSRNDPYLISEETEASVTYLKFK